MKTSLRLTALAGVLVLLGLPGVAHAQCDDFDIVLADGRPRTVTIPFNAGGTFVRGIFFRGAPGRSYSVEVFASVTASVGEIFLGAANDQSCPLANAAGVRDTTDIEPRGFNGPKPPKRFSFTATAPITDPNFPFFATRVRNFSTTTPQTVTGTVTDTTLFNPRWSTFGGFFTSWGFQNNTNAACTVTLTVIKTIPAPTATLTTVTFPVPAGEVVFQDTRPAPGLNLAANQAGNAIATHDCPPGGIGADAFFLNASATVIVPAKFGTRTSEE